MEVITALCADDHLRETVNTGISNHKSALNQESVVQLNETPFRIRFKRDVIACVIRDAESVAGSDILPDCHPRTILSESVR